MRINLSAKPKSGAGINNLWRNSPCSLNYIVSNTASDRANRFQIGSIYHRDQVDKPKKVFNEFQKPDMVRNQFIRLIEEASHPKYYSAAKKNAEKIEKDTRARTKTQFLKNTAVQKLYSVPMKSEYQYDRGGYRSHAFGDYNAKDIETKVLKTRRNFSSGRRLDLARPLNFFPGPGTYNPEPENRTETPLTMRTCINFKKSKYSAQENLPQTERVYSKDFANN